MDTKKNPAGINPRLDEPAPLLAHLEALRKCLVVAAIAIALCSVLAYSWVDPILKDLARPIGKLYFTTPMEAFWSKFKLAFFIGVFLSSPVVLFQLGGFIQRGLFPKEKKFLFWLAASAFVLFAAGSAFSYFLVLPAGVKFLLEYGSDTLVPMITISRYLSFAFGMVFSFGIIFELPLVIAVLVKMGLLKSLTLRRNRRYAIVLIFIAAAILTPSPDAFNQVLMAGPLLVLYEIGIIVARIIERRRK